jgi:hypothetical protein
MDRCRNRLGLLGYFWLAICAAGLFATPYGQARADVWTVSGVRVDVTAENAPQAKVIAIGEAQVVAFKRLVDRVVPSASAAKLKKLKPESVGRLMASLSIEEEQVAPKRYIAKLAIRFLQNKTKALFAQYGARFAEKQSEPILVIPVWLTSESADMWGKKNPWRKAWDSLDTTNSLMPFIFPVGDATDKAAISAADAVKGKWPKLEALQIRYGASAIIVLAAEPKSDVSVRAVMFGSSPAGSVSNDNTYSGDDLESASEVAARSMFLSVQGMWKTKHLKSFQRATKVSSANVLKIAVPLTSMAEWNVMRSRIQATTGVGRIDINALSARGAAISLAFAGSISALRNSFYQTGFALQQVNGTWVLQKQ